MKTNNRHPGGRTCQVALPFALMMMPYALFCYVRDERRAKKVTTRS